jgi:hypothetical protein
MMIFCCKAARSYRSVLFILDCPEHPHPQPECHLFRVKTAVIEKSSAISVFFDNFIVRLSSVHPLSKIIKSCRVNEIPRSHRMNSMELYNRIRSVPACSENYGDICPERAFTKRFAAVSLAEYTYVKTSGSGVHLDCSSNLKSLFVFDFLRCFFDISLTFSLGHMANLFDNSFAFFVCFRDA